MDTLSSFASLCLHVDQYLAAVIAQHGSLTYALLAAIVFLETGVVVTPFLPGDSMLFAAGSLAAVGALDVWTVAGVLIAAATAGDTMNYAIGGLLRSRLAKAPRQRWLNPDHLRRTTEFFEHHGPKTIVIARFVPIVRTFAPFVAGLARMPYARFAAYNVTGAVAWVGVCLGAGYVFGGLPVVKNNFGLVVIAIVVVSLLPAAWECAACRRMPASSRGPGVAQPETVQE